MITFPRRVYDELVRDAYRGEKEEICGILAGNYEEDRSRVTSVHRAQNAADTPTVRYAIDPEEQLVITEQIEGDGLDVVGFYHSHPAGPPGPSETDRSRATWPNRSYVIVAMDGYPYVGSWRWRANQSAFEAERVMLTQD